jgi:hypothetical protein
VLQEEGIHSIEPIATAAAADRLKDTLLCFVLVDPSSAHAFCSSYDFGPWPLLAGVESLPPAAMQVRASLKPIGHRLFYWHAE